MVFTMYDKYDEMKHVFTVALEVVRDVQRAAYHVPRTT